MASREDSQQVARILGMLVLAGILVSCAVGTHRLLVKPTPYYGSDSDGAIEMVGGPRISHDVHAEMDMECSDCHEIDEETGNFVAITLELCMDCHEDIDEELPEGDPKRVAENYFDAEGNPKWTQAIVSYDEEIIFRHDTHVEGRECADCHGKMGGYGPRPRRMLFDMAGCVDCHAQAKASNACETCHKEIRIDKAPPSHAAAGFMQGHGAISPTGRGDTTAEKCDMCHSVPNDCKSCHVRTPPADHSAPGFMRSHGQQILYSRGTSAQERCDMCHHERRDCDKCHEENAPLSHRRNWMFRHGHLLRGAGHFEQARCAYCHSDEQFCERCHKVEAPRNHTMLFRNRTHGALASMDRESCKTCHNTPFCVRCHETVQPRSHKGQFASGRHNHCCQCHYPITQTQSCWVCHKSNPTHPTAPPMPPGHNAGWTCRNCHNSVGGGGAPPLRHCDNGQACQSCHR